MSNIQVLNYSKLEHQQVLQRRLLNMKENVSLRGSYSQHLLKIKNSSKLEATSYAGRF